MANKIQALDESHEYDPSSQLELVEETCVAHFLGGPLSGVRDPEFVWKDEYRRGGSYFAWPVWKQEDPEDTDSVRLLGSYKYDIEVVKVEGDERLILCKNEGFSDEGVGIGQA